jgi:hypothetical protein
MNLSRAGCAAKARRTIRGARKFSECMMIRTISLALAAQAMLAGVALAADAAPIYVELNSLESAQNHCRVSFVVQNKAEAPIESLKLDLIAFNRDGVIARRLVVEMGPIRKEKTMVRTFNLEGACGNIGSVLVNDVPACTPGDAGACVDRLELSSRVPDVKFYK